MSGYAVGGLRFCAWCGRAYNYNGVSDLCPICQKRDEETFKRIKEYLWQYPYSSVGKVALDLGLSVSTIRKYIREERIDVVKREGQKAYCKRCFTIINSGDYCDRCSVEMQHMMPGQPRVKGNVMTSGKKGKFRYI